MFFRKKKKHFLSVVAIFKNESHCIKEWIEHYLNEGADHFYLINNGSTDDFQNKIDIYLSKGLITLIHDNKKWAQVELYNKYLLPKKNESNWFLIVDLDEFVYARSKYKTIKDFLKPLSSFVGLIRIPWKMFGSSRFIEQPESVIPSFTMRCLYEKNINPGMKDDSKSLSKAIVRGSYLKHISIHTSFISKICLVVNSSGRIIRNSDKEHQLINERILSQSYLHLNHYALQSKNWFLNVKCKRGAADTKRYENVRNLEYFESYNEKSNAVNDDELAKKR